MDRLCYTLRSISQLETINDEDVVMRTLQGLISRILNSKPWDIAEKIGLTRLQNECLSRPEDFFSILYYPSFSHALKYLLSYLGSSWHPLITHPTFKESFDRAPRTVRVELLLNINKLKPQHLTSFTLCESKQMSEHSQFFKPAAAILGLELKIFNYSAIQTPLAIVTIPLGLSNQIKMDCERMHDAIETQTLFKNFVREKLLEINIVLAENNLLSFIPHFIKGNTSISTYILSTEIISTPSRLLTQFK